MRALASSLALLLLATPAHADSFVDIAGGLSIPMGDDDWTEVAESSPKLALRIGSLPQNIGGMLQADWTPTNTDTTSGQFPGGSADISAHRFRVLLGAVFRHDISNSLAFSGRAGAGIDVAYASSSVEFLGNRTETSDSDVGLALEVGGGLWFKSGSMWIGGEVAIPIAMHDHDGDIDFQYTSYDLDVLVGVRFFSN